VRGEKGRNLPIIISNWYEPSTKKGLASRFRRTPGKYYLIEERYATGAALLRGVKKGLFAFTMMMEAVRITKSLWEICSFCMPQCQHGPYQFDPGHL
jgi:hypothetical protein